MVVIRLKPAIRINNLPDLYIFELVKYSVIRVVK